MKAAFFFSIREKRGNPAEDILNFHSPPPKKSQVQACCQPPELKWINTVNVLLSLHIFQTTKYRILSPPQSISYFHYTIWRLWNENILDLNSSVEIWHPSLQDISFIYSANFEHLLWHTSPVLWSAILSWTSVHSRCAYRSPSKSWRTNSGPLCHLLE